MVSTTLIHRNVKWLKFLPYYRRNLKLAFPIIFAQLGQVSVALTDTLMVGRLGTVELAAVAFANSVFALFFIFGLGFSLGLTPLVGNAYGKRQFQKAGVLFQNALLINIIVAIVLFLLIWNLGFLMFKLNQPQAVVEMAMPYFNMTALSLIPISIFFSCRQFGEGIGNTKISMWITLAANAVNIFFNYCLIYGKCGFPELGVVGAGMATVIARSFMAVAFIIVVLKHPVYNIYLKYFTWENFKKSYIFRLVKTGVPISGQLVVEVLAFSLSAIMIGWLNEVSLAAHQIVLQLASATFMMAIGVASATTIRISHQFGAKHYKAVQFASIAAMHIVIVFMLFTALLFVLFRYQIPALFTTDTQVIAIAAQLLIVAAVFQLFDGLQIVGLAVLRGLADVTFAMWAAFISYLGLCLPMGYMFGFVCGFGAVGVWIGLALGLACAGVIYRYRFVRYMKTKIPIKP